MPRYPCLRYFHHFIPYIFDKNLPIGPIISRGSLRIDRLYFSSISRKDSVNSRLPVSPLRAASWEADRMQTQPYKYGARKEVRVESLVAGTFARSGQGWSVRDRLQILLSQLEWFCEHLAVYMTCNS
jgi:hypothetical protein